MNVTPKICDKGANEHLRRITVEVLRNHASKEASLEGQLERACRCPALVSTEWEQSKQGIICHLTLIVDVNLSVNQVSSRQVLAARTKRQIT